jgi:shikimate 5-dehydrogenase
MGAGGSSIALSSYIMRNSTRKNRPRRIIVSNRSQPRLTEIERIHRHIFKEGNLRIPTEYHLTPDHEDNDEICSCLSPGSLIVNGTGLGKDAPGSPLTDAARFPADGFVWEFNYRGDLLFMDQARRQQEEKNLTLIDGWDYFIYGWTRVIADVFHVDIPVSGEGFDEISRIAAEARGT